MKVGDYVRTKYGIAKYIGDKATRVTIYKVIDKDIVYDNVEGWENILLDKEIIKSSPNIIDLIEVGDYVNGYLVKDIDYAFDDVVMNNKNARIVPYIDCNKDNYIDNIKSIVTKEQFESMEYRIGE